MEKKVNIICLGDIPENNLTLLKRYMNLSDSNCKQHLKYTFKKEIKEESYAVTFQSFSVFDLNDLKTFLLADGIIILFDMSNRDEFNDILEKWLVNLRKHCSYKGRIMLLGEDRKEKELRIGMTTSEFYVKDEELDDTIVSSEVDENIEFVKLSSNDLVEIIDSFIVDLSDNVTRNEDNSNALSWSPSPLNQQTFCFIY